MTRLAFDFAAWAVAVAYCHIWEISLAGIFFGGECRGGGQLDMHKVHLLSNQISICFWQEFHLEIPSCDWKRKWQRMTQRILALDLWISTTQTALIDCLTSRGAVGLLSLTQPQRSGAISFNNPLDSNVRGCGCGSSCTNFSDRSKHFVTTPHKHLVVTNWNDRAPAPETGLQWLLLNRSNLSLANKRSRQWVWDLRLPLHSEWKVKFRPADSLSGQHSSNNGHRSHDNKCPAGEMG